MSWATLVLLTATFFGGLSYAEEKPAGEMSLEELRALRDQLRHDTGQLRATPASQAPTEVEGPAQTSGPAEVPAPAEATEEPSGDASDAGAATGVPREHLREARERLLEEIGELKEEIAEAKADLKENLAEMKEEMRDEQRDLRDDLQDVRGKGRLRARKHWSVLLVPQLAWMDTDPIADLSSGDRTLKGKSFDFDLNKSLSLGVLGYGDVDNGLRFGSGLSVSYRPFRSGPYSGMHLEDSTVQIGWTDTTGVERRWNTTTLSWDTTGYSTRSYLRDSVASTDTTYHDSVVTLHVLPATFGFLFEKAFVFNQFNVFVGTMIGGGAITVIKEAQAYTDASVFTGESGGGGPKVSAAVAPCVMFDLHGGVGFELTPSFHIGVDGVVNFMYAYNGFGAGFGGFMAVSPGVRLRLAFGRAG